MLNLNKVRMPHEDHSNGAPLIDYGMQKGNTQVIFRELESVLIKQIEKADAVFGCVAWLTSTPILDALAECPNASIIVQKEDFLRPDLNASNNWKSVLQQQYAKLVCKLNRFSLKPSILPEASYKDACFDMLPIRCVGNHNSDKKATSPRMHNKFLVFASLTDIVEEHRDFTTAKVNPYAVWTGSFNFTRNGGNSLENAVLIHDPDIAMAYFMEYGQIAALSEKLNWKTDWCEPEWRIGS